MKPVHFSSDKLLQDRRASTLLQGRKKYVDVYIYFRGVYNFENSKVLDYTIPKEYIFYNKDSFYINTVHNSSNTIGWKMTSYH